MIAFDLLGWAQVATPIIAVVIGAYLSNRIHAVHKLVNQKSETQENRIVQLKEVIASSNKEIPDTTRETGIDTNKETTTE